MVYDKYMIYAENKKAYYDYEILEKFEAGIELKGYEAKAITSGKVSLLDAYGIIRNNEVFIVNLNIPPYQPKNIRENYDPQRTRRLLMKKSEIQSLIGKMQTLTLIPLKIYNKKSKIKIELGLARRKKKKDKREKIKKEEDLRKIRKIQGGASFDENLF